MISATPIEVAASDSKIINSIKLILDNLKKVKKCIESLIESISNRLSALK